MPQNAFYKLATVTLSGTDTAVTFDSIPTDGTYRDLFITAHIPEQGSDVGMELLVDNSTTAADYYGMYFRNRLDNSTIQFSRFAGSRSGVLLQNSGYPQATQVIDIFEFAENDKYTYITGQSRDEEYDNTVFNSYRQLTAVSRIDVYTRANTMGVGTKVSLWGIKG